VVAQFGQVLGICVVEISLDTSWYVVQRRLLLMWWLLPFIIPPFML
jgi:hypothetical protein